MARLPPIKRLTTEDFKDQASWIGKLLLPLNDFMSTVSRALSKGLTFTDNFSAQVRELVHTESADAYPVKFLSTLPSRPVGLWVVRARDMATTPQTLAGGVSADWDFKDGQVIINKFTGLTTGRKYDLCVIIITG